ncbi:flagellar export chaperone FlgN [Roseiconus lacunae]|uniref:flagellar export chaperone FlgN n=1 Tax=Roseiconus lacunae TaxID=2605694 RepID=UPI003088037A|nr:flagellar export chaperone FlgN [Stieleria sp. HD01]
MRLQTDQFDEMLEGHLALEERLAETLEELNQAMTTMLNKQGVRGPTPEVLDQVTPLIDRLRERSEQSRQSRERLLEQLPESEDSAKPQSQGLRQLIRQASDHQVESLDQRRIAVRDRIEQARHTLTANQAVIFYSMDFHRRYLMGVLQCTDDRQGYQADGQSTKLPAEKIFGRNC